MRLTPALYVSGARPAGTNVAADGRPPYSACAAIMGAFAGGLAVTGLLGRESGEHTALDLFTLVVANFKAAHTLAHDEVRSFLREPIVKGHAHEGAEDPAEGGMRQAIGELVTCTRCVGTWTAAGLAATQAAYLALVVPLGALLGWASLRSSP